MAKICYICVKTLEDKYADDKKIVLLQVVGVIQVNIEMLQYSICNLKYSIPTVTTLILNNGSNYDYNFTIKDLAEEFEGKFTCLGKNTEKHTTFPVLIEKEAKRIDKRGMEISNTIAIELLFIDSPIFMASLM